MGELKLLCLMDGLHGHLECELEVLPGARASLVLEPLRSAVMGDSFTIQISSNLINKLARDGGEPEKSPKKSKPMTPPVPLKHPVEPNSTLTEPKSGSSGAWPPQTSMFLPMPVTMPPPPASVSLAELEAIRSVLKESESMVKKFEEKETDMTQELTQRAKELRDKEFKLPYQKSIPCEAEREAFRECYKENLKQPLKCAQVVRSFEDCARRAQRQLQLVNSEL